MINLPELSGLVATPRLDPRHWLAPFFLALTVAGAGVLLAIDPAVAFTALAMVGVLLVWLAGGGLRTFVSVLLLACVPVAAGAARYGHVLPGSVGRVQDLALAAGICLGGSYVLSARGDVRRLTTVLVTFLTGGQFIGMVHTHGTLTLALGATWQDVRWVGALGWGVYLARDMSWGDAYRWTFRLTAVWSGLQVLVSAAQIASGRVSGSRFSIPVATGAFGHPTLGSLAGTTLLILVFADARAVTPFLTHRQRVLGGVIAVLAILTSTRTKPFVALAGVGLVYVAQRVSRSSVVTAAAFVAVPVIFLAALPLASRADTAPGAHQTLVENVAAHAVPRVTLLQGARRLADNSFPFGWGLGTYGSNLDANVENQAFFAAGLGDTWGFSAASPDFRFDSLAAHVLAERGWLGTAVWLGGLTVLLFMTLRISPQHFFPAAVVSAAAAIAPVTPSLHDGSIALLLLVPVGLCMAASAERPTQQSHERTHSGSGVKLLERNRTGSRTVTG